MHNFLTQKGLKQIQLGFKVLTPKSSVSKIYRIPSIKTYHVLNGFQGYPFQLPGVVDKQ